MFNEYTILSLFLGCLFISIVILCLIYCNNNNYIDKYKNDKILII